MSRNGFGKFALGLGIGVGAALLLAPQSGEKTRKELKAKLRDLLDSLDDIDYNEVRDNLANKVKDLQNELADLDKEKVVKIARQKAEDIKRKADDIYKEAVKQGKPKVEAAAKEVRNKAAEVLRNMANTIDANPKKA